MLADCPLDVLSINETRLDDSIKDHNVYIPGYEIIRCDRATNGRSGGGICFYIRASINYLPRPDLNINQLENLSIKIRYHPPDSPIEIFTHFESLVGKLDVENVEFYLMGDFNCNLVSPNLNNNSTTLTSIAEVYSLHQLINEPTRVTMETSTLIDVKFTNSPDRVVCSGVSHIL